MSTIGASMDILLKGQLNFLKKYFEVVAISGEDGHLKAVREREGVRTVHVSMERSINILKDVQSLIKMYIVFKNEKPYIVHSFTPKAGLISMVAGYFAGVPIRIHTFTGLVFPSRIGRLRYILKTIDKIICLFATKIIPEGEGVKNDLISEKITNKNLSVIANGNINGVDIDYFNPSLAAIDPIKIRTSLNIDINDIIFIFIGRIVKDKGIHELIQAFIEISNEFENAKLLLVGSYQGERDAISDYFLNSIQSNSKILHVGFQLDIRPYLEVSDVFVLPSYREGFPNSVLQAGAFAKAVIVTDINGSNEIVINNINGLIVSPKSVIELIEAMRLLLLNETLRNEFGKSLQTRVREKFNNEIVWNETKKMYDRLLMKKLIRITTVAESIDKLLKNQLNFVGQHFEITAVANGQDILDFVGLREGVNTYNINFTRKITPIQDFLSFLSLIKFLIINKPFIVHTHTPKAGLIGMLASRILGVKHRLHTVAGLPLMEAKGFKRVVLNFTEYITYKCATKVYPNSFVLEDFIIKNKFTSFSKLKVLGNGSSNGIDTNYFDINAVSNETILKCYGQLNLNKNDFIFIFIGRVVRDKGITELVKAFLRFSINYINAKLLIVGSFESDLDPINESILNEIATKESIIHVGHVYDVRPYLAISQVFILPSYREGFPNVVLQAGAMGLPCIVSNINGCNEIISDYENGLIVPPKDFESLSNAMLRIYEDKDLYQRLKSNARNKIKSRFEQRDFHNLLLQEYFNLK